MITSTRKYGSYVLEDVGIHDIAPSSSNVVKQDLFKTNCAIPKEWISLELLEIRKYNHDTSILRFSLPEGKTRLDLPVGSFLLIKAPGCENDGRDAIRPYTSVSDDDNLVSKNENTGSFEILCKRYDEWGTKENATSHFLFTKTNHSYRPPGSASNYIHKLVVGESLSFQYTSDCIGRVNFPFLEDNDRGGVKRITMIAVGVGIAPMIHTLRAIFRHRDRQIDLEKKSIETNENSSTDSSSSSASTKIMVQLLYGVREVTDILLREQIETWREKYSDIFSVLYCVGSRWANIHMGMKTKDSYIPPPIPKGFPEISDHAELGWVNEDKIKRHSFPPDDDTLVLVCGLPGVYEKLCGPRGVSTLSEGSALHTLGYAEHMVVKL